MRKLYVLFAAIIAVPLVVTGTSLRAQTTGLWDVYNTVFTFNCIEHRDIPALIPGANAEHDVRHVGRA